MGPGFYSLGMLLLASVNPHDITKDSVRLLFLREMIANEENQ